VTGAGKLTLRVDRALPGLCVNVQHWQRHPSCPAAARRSPARPSGPACDVCGIGVNREAAGSYPVSQAPPKPRVAFAISADRRQFYSGAEHDSSVSSTRSVPSSRRSSVNAASTGGVSVIASRRRFVGTR
jgi:hypothetical protein